MTQRQRTSSTALEKKGGYTGGAPASTVRRPAPIPSGARRPATNTSNSGSGHGTANSRQSGSNT